MLNAKAYYQAFSYGDYSKAESYSDLVTLFADELDAIIEVYRFYKYDKRKRYFDPLNKDEVEKHKTARPLEYGMNAAFENLINFLPEPKEASIIQKIFKLKDNDWPDSHANNLETKINNAQKAIKILKDRHKIELRKSFYYQDDKIFVRYNGYVDLVAGTFSSALAKCLFEDIHKTWKKGELFEAISDVFGYHEESTERDEIYVKNMRRACQTINDKINNLLKNNDKLVVYSQDTVKLNMDLFHITDRVISLNLS